MALRSIASLSYHPALHHLPEGRVELGSTISPAPISPRPSYHPCAVSCLYPTKRAVGGAECFLGIQTLD